MTQMTAGEFARVTGLSTKALRLYAESGLLVPERIDRFNGYRYYGDDQRERAERITMLRRAGMPLAQVARLMQVTGQDAADQLTTWWRREEAEFAERRGTVDHLFSLLVTGTVSAPAIAVHERPVPPREVVCSRHRVLQPDLVDVFLTARDRLTTHLIEHGARPTGEYWVAYHGLVSPDSDGPIEVIVPFEGPAVPATPGPEGIQVRTEAAGAELFAPISADLCAYPAILVAYRAVHDAAQGRQARAVARERYFTDWDGSPGAEHVADVVLPIATAAEHSASN